MKLDIAHFLCSLAQTMAYIFRNLSCNQRRRREREESEREEAERRPDRDRSEREFRETWRREVRERWEMEELGRKERDETIVQELALASRERRRNERRLDRMTVALEDICGVLNRIVQSKPVRKCVCSLHPPTLNIHYSEVIIASSPYIFMVPNTFNLLFPF